MSKSKKSNLRWWGSMALVLLVVLALTIFSACAGEPGAQGPQGAQGPPGDVTTVPTFAIKLDANEPGCGGVCHEAMSPRIQPPTGAYTLAYEANHAWAGHGFDAVEGPLLTLNDCLACHAVGTGARAGKGNVSSKSLRDIVHRVHVTSEHFTVELDEEERQGDCFTCHVVSGPSATGLYD